MDDKKYLTVPSAIVLKIQAELFAQQQLNILQVIESKDNFSGWVKGWVKTWVKLNHIFAV